MDKIDDLIKQPGWHWLKLLGPGVDEYGHTMEDGTYYPPTFKRSFQICALRSDGTYFSINVIFEPDVDRDLLKKIGTQFKNSLETLETFRTCECLLGKTCEKHGGSADV